MKHFFSTLSADTGYAKHKILPDGSYRTDHVVVIKGGAGVANKHVITPRGVHTAVSDEDYEAIKADPVLALHIANGFVIIESDKADAEKVAADMAQRDGSSPLTPQDYELTGKKAPTAGAAKPAF